jgi:hypothetical protein
MSSLTVLLGTMLYACIKISGYTFFARYLNRLFACPHSIWKIGFIRTLLGVVLGLAHNAFFLSFFKVTMGRAPLGGEDTLLYFIVLVLLRVFEWWLIIYWFYDRTLQRKNSMIKAIVLGILWSFILDIPLLAGLFTVAASIC